jgi:SAM-dependent methyltransferase
MMTRDDLVSSGTAASNDPEFVRTQYASTDNLESRSHVWHVAQAGAPTPQDFIVGELQRRRVADVLEVGCGEGSLALRIRNEVACRLAVSDSSPAMVASSKAKDLDATLTSVESLPYDSNQYDAVVAAWSCTTSQI